MDLFAGNRLRTANLDASTWQPTLSTLTWTLLTLILVSVTTRFVTTRTTAPKAITINGNPARVVPRVPYWLPILGNLPSMIWDASSFTRDLRERYATGVFALNFGGTTHNIISSPGLATALLNQDSSNADFERVVHRILINVFGMPAREPAVWGPAYAEIAACFKYLLTEPSHGMMVAATVKKARENIVNLVSFTDNMVDQTLWERVSNVTVKKNEAGDEVVEASLLPLVRDFCAHSANASIIGSNFLTKFPDFFEDLWTFDRAFLLLAIGLPRWLPIPLLTRAHIARRKLVAAVSTFHEAMEKEASGQDPGPDWQDLDDVSTLIKERMKIYRKDGLSIRARAVCEVNLLWAANANSNVLVFWMINRIYADSELLGRIREEIAIFVKAIQPKQEFPVPEPSRLESIDVDNLCTKCPLLKSCYIECLRLDTASWSLKQVRQDFVLQSREHDAPGWLLRKGEYAHAAHDLHNTDPRFFDDPMTWKADRHVRFEGEKKEAVVDLGSIRPYGKSTMDFGIRDEVVANSIPGGGTSMCKGRAFALKECMVFAAAIIALWDIEPAGGGGWKMPRHRKATGVYNTSDNTRVWIKRRELPITK